MGSRRDAYIEAHSLVFDLEHSDCKECYSKHLECSYYYGECRNEVWMSGYSDEYINKELGHLANWRI